VRINVPLAPPADGASFYSFLLENLSAGKQVNIVTDQWNNPLDTDRIARWSWEAWQKGTRGCLHLAGGTYATRFDIARIVAQYLDVDSALVKPIKTADLGQKAPRPERGGLLIARQAELFGTAPDLPTILKSLPAGLT
jgi:dTDP-4-dehydrorhamnose reductase